MCRLSLDLMGSKIHEREPGKRSVDIEQKSLSGLIGKILIKVDVMKPTIFTDVLLIELTQIVSIELIKPFYDWFTFRANFPEVNSTTHRNYYIPRIELCLRPPKVKFLW